MNKVFDAYALYYDKLYKDKDYKKEVDYLINLLANQKILSGSILDLGCGTGVHDKFLAEEGFFVHGVDKSPEMIKIALSKNIEKYSERLSFDVGDIKSYKSEKKFDAVISLFHVTSYQTPNEELLSMFRTASKHLNKEGIFIFDFWYGPAVLTERPSVRVKRFDEDGVNIIRIAEPKIHFNKNIVDVNYTILVTNSSDNKTEILSEKHSMRYLFKPEIKSLLSSVEMELVNSYEWLSTNSLGEKSWQGVIVAKK